MRETLESIEDKFTTWERVIWDQDLDALINHHIPNKFGAYYRYQQQDFEANGSIHTWWEAYKRELDPDEVEQIRAMQEDWANPVAHGLPAEYNPKDYNDPLRIRLSQEVVNDPEMMKKYEGQEKLAQEALGRGCPAGMEAILTHLANIGAISEGPVIIHVDW